MHRRPFVLCLLSAKVLYLIRREKAGKTEKSFPDRQRKLGPWSMDRSG